VSTIARHRGLAACAGLIAGPAVWAANTQLGEILPYTDCASGFRWSALNSFLAVLVSLAAAAVSWRAARAEVAGQEPDRSMVFDFTGGFSALLALVFAFALLLQGLASLVLTGCER
jgi:hypothetical protein